eukprot:Lankesteria_metandrocarpae@DN3262_c0_g1_i1.p2
MAVVMHIDLLRCGCPNGAASAMRRHSPYRRRMSSVTETPSKPFIVQYSCRHGCVSPAELSITFCIVNQFSVYPDEKSSDAYHSNVLRFSLSRFAVHSAPRDDTSSVKVSCTMRLFTEPPSVQDFCNAAVTFSMPTPAVHDSLSTPAVHDSLSTPAVHDSLSTPAVHDSLSTPAVHDSLSTPAVHDSLSTPAVHDSLSTPAVHDSLSTPAVHDSLSTPAVHD